MNRDIKYVCMDVHKEATVIAVLNGTGTLVMESIVEAPASSILQFIHGLLSELHMTWEEGTWIADQALLHVGRRWNGVARFVSSMFSLIGSKCQSLMSAWGLRQSS